MKASYALLRLFLASALSFSVLFSGFNHAPQAHAEGPADPAPQILHVGTANGKKVLFDNTHGQTAGAADWVIDGAFSDFGNALANQGYDVKELRKTTPIVLSDLSGYDVFVIGEANVPYKTSEQTAMVQYVQNGGSIFFIADHYNADRNKNRWDSSEIFNGYRRGAWANPAQGMSAEESNSAAMSGVASSDWLGTNFGVRFRYNAIGNVTANQIVAPSQAFNITSGVSTVAMHAGSTLAIIDPNKAKGIVYLPPTTAKWGNAVDQGVYAGGGTAEGPYAAIAKVGAGKAAFIGDSSPVEDATPKYKREETGGTKTTYAGFQEQNDATLLVNIVNWLSAKESYTSLNQVSGLTLDQPTPLLAMENPQTSTEPQSEPWAAPAAGYKWYDSSTFKSGSYGYGTTGGDPGGGGVSGIFFSEYIEGSSNNKAVEIYNGTGAGISLAGYSVSSSNTGTAINLSGTLAHGDVYVVANSSADAGILSQADLLTGNLSFNGDDSVTLSNNGTVLDVIGTAGNSFGTDKTLVRKGTVSAGLTAYDAAQWTAYASNTFSYLGSHTGTAPAAAMILNEAFENGSKGSYTAGNVTLATGSWNMDNALIGNLSTDKKNGLQAARIRSAGSITMNFNVAGAKTVKISHANFSTDTGAAWKLQKSINGGSSWTDVTGTVTSSSSLAVQSITVNETAGVRFRILVSGTAGSRINIDDVQIFN
ncbi:lamin tail domain-containing protein [Paenibacillus harenae]|uniref:lamin tail domain-containing protein n=1 Tax=Paenibacillus harenae TaxID=306543 RepID=UPI0003F602B6|nr:lamin tail domain-containing protein [Paenibacillus harenae]